MPSFTRESGGTQHVAVMGVNRIGKEPSTHLWAGDENGAKRNHTWRLERNCPGEAIDRFCGQLCCAAERRCARPGAHWRIRQRGSAQPAPDSKLSLPDPSGRSVVVVSNPVPNMLSIAHDSNANVYVYRGVDNETNEVQAQWPTEQALKRMALMREMSGKLFDVES